MLFTDKENDVSFVLEDKLVIFIEHQSTINNNMPLRFIEYLSANYRFIKSKRKYSGTLMNLPRTEAHTAALPSLRDRGLGGGVRKSNGRESIAKSGCSQVHFSLRTAPAGPDGEAPLMSEAELSALVQYVRSRPR